MCPNAPKTVLAASVVVLAGCEAVRPPAAQRPDDFQIHVMVVPEPEADHAASPRWARPASYVIEPGGIVRAEFGEAVMDGRLSPIARELSWSETEAFYAAALDSGVLGVDPTAAGGRFIPAIAIFERSGSDTGAVALFDVTSDGWSRVVAADLSSADAAGPRALVDRLADLVWQRD